MAKSNVFLLFMLLMALRFSISHTLTLFGLVINEARIRGVLECTFIGDLSAQPVSNAQLYLRCGGSNSTIAETVTDLVGAYEFVLATADTLLVSPSECDIFAVLPTGTCEIYPPDGILYASVNFLGITISGVLVIANYFGSTFLPTEGP